MTGFAAAPRQHLGEAQTCWLLDNDPAWRGSWWVTDDRDAYHYAKGRGIRTWRTIDIVRAVVADGDLTAERAYALMQAMRDADRGVVLPTDPGDLR